MGALWSGQKLAAISGSLTDPSERHTENVMAALLSLHTQGQHRVCLCLLTSSKNPILCWSQRILAWNSWMLTFQEFFEPVVRHTHYQKVKFIINYTSVTNIQNSSPPNDFALNYILEVFYIYFTRMLKIQYDGELCAFCFQFHCSVTHIDSLKWTMVRVLTPQK